jgi:MFS family permease
VNPRTPDAVRGQVLAARTSVYAVFAVNGLLLSTLLARVPAIRADLGLTPQELGLTLLAASTGSVLALPTAGSLVQRLGVRPVVLAAALLGAAGVAGAGLAPDRLLLMVALFAWGFANGAWDVAMNVEAADVERRLGTTIMPRFHGAWSAGTVLGAGIAALAAFLSVGRGPHLLALSVVVLLGAVLSVRSFLPKELGSRGAQDDHDATTAAAGGSTRRYSLLDAWREPRTLLIGVTMLGFALAEGIAGDWLAVAVIDSRGAQEWVGRVDVLGLPHLGHGRALRRPGAAGPLRPLPPAAGHGRDDRGRGAVRRVPARRPRRRRGCGAVGGRRQPGLPGRHDGRRRRPGQGRGPRVGGRLGRLHRLPRRPAAGRRARRAPGDQPRPAHRLRRGAAVRVHGGRHAPARRRGCGAGHGRDGPPPSLVP